MIRVYCSLAALFILLNGISAAENLDFSVQQRAGTLQALVSEANKAQKSSFKISTWKSNLRSIERIQDMQAWTSKERRQLLYVLSLIPAQIYNGDLRLGHMLAEKVDLTDTIELRLLFDLLRLSKVNGLDAPRIYVAMLKDPYLANMRSRYFNYFSKHKQAVDAYLSYCINKGVSQWSDLDLKNLATINISKELFSHVISQAVPLLDRRETPEVVNQALHILIRSEQIIHFDKEVLERLLHSDNAELLNLGFGLLLLGDQFAAYRNRNVLMKAMKRLPPHEINRALSVAPYLTLAVVYFSDLTVADLRFLMKSSDPLLRFSCILALRRHSQDVDSIILDLSLKDGELLSLCRFFSVEDIFYNRPPRHKKYQPIKRVMQLALHDIQENTDISVQQRSVALLDLMQGMSSEEKRRLLTADEFKVERYAASEALIHEFSQQLMSGCATCLQLLERLDVDPAKVLQWLKLALSSEDSLSQEDMLMASLLQKEMTDETVGILRHRGSLEPKRVAYSWLSEALLDDNGTRQVAFPGFRDLAFRSDLANSLRLIHALRAHLVQYEGEMNAPKAVLLWNQERGVSDLVQLLSIDFR